MSSTRHWVVVRRGDTGLNVRMLQHFLRVHRQTVAVDGIFGPRTGAAVRRFQHTHHLTPDAAVGDQTWPPLTVLLSLGSSGEAVRAAQEQLAARRLAETRGLRIDGAFGPQTRRAVVGFQNYVHHRRPHGEDLQVDGIIGVHTWHALEIGLGARN